MSHTSSEDDLLVWLAEEFADRRRRGEHPALSEYVDLYPALAHQIRDLFPAMVAMEEFGSVAGPAAGPHAAGAMPDGTAPRQLGEYRILRELARGGMGIVYEAVQEPLGRHVALKVLPFRTRNDATRLGRFRREARAGAQLHHTNIVPVFGVGQHEGVHYYAMQLIQGQGLDRVLNELKRLRQGRGSQLSQRVEGGEARPKGRLDSELVDTLAQELMSGQFVGEEASAVAPQRDGGVDGTPGRAPSAPREGEDAANRRGEPTSTEPLCGQTDLTVQSEAQYFRSVAWIGMQVAEALARAHQQGILHRDIKPANLLLDHQGTVWVTDFGLAKSEGTEELTTPGDVVGTARYMAPERFRGQADRRSDIYSLGLTLYELLTLRPAFEATERAQLVEQLLHQEPPRPRTLEPRIPRDLETVILKAIAKEPDRRYQSAGDFAEDLRRFLGDRPIKARRSTPIEQFGRWCRRNPYLAAALTSTATAVVALALVSTMMAWKFREQRDQVRQAERQIRENLFNALAAQARATRFSRQKGQRFDSLDALTKAAVIARELKRPRETFDQLRDEAIACLALPDLKPAGRVIARPPRVYSASFDPTMTRYALRFKDGTIQVRGVADDREVARFQARGDREVQILHFSPDGRYLVTTDYPGFALTVWDIERRAVAAHDSGPVRGHAARFSPDSRRLALVKETLTPRGFELVIYELASGQSNQHWRMPGSADLAFRPDGTQIAVSDNESKPPACRILEVGTGRLVQTIALPVIGGWMAWSPDGTALAVAGVDHKFYVFDGASGVRKATLEGHTSSGLVAAFHPAGTLVASNGWEARLWLWDPVLGRPLLSVASGLPLEFRRDGSLVVSAEDSFAPHQVDPAWEYRTLGHPARRPIRYGAPLIRRDGRLLAVGTSQGVAFWDLACGVELGFLPIGYTAWPVIEASGDLLTSGSIGVWRWPIQLDPDRGEFRIGPPQQLPLPARTNGIAKDRSGRIVAQADIAVAHVLTPERALDIGPLDDCRSVSVSPDGEWLAAGSHDKAGAQVWRLHSAERVAELAVEGLISVVFSPDGKWLMTCAPPCRLWAVGTWRETWRIKGAIGLGFSADGRMIVAVDARHALHLVETETGRTLARLESPDLHAMSGATFSPDGTRLVVTTNDGPAVHVWDLRAIRRQLAEMGLDWDAPSISVENPAGPAAPPLPPLEVDYGPLARDLEHFTEPAESLIERYSARLKTVPNDIEAFHHRAHALVRLGRFQEGLDDWTEAIRLRPDDAHLRDGRAQAYAALKRYEPAIADLEAALEREPDQFFVRELLADCCNERAWWLAVGPEPERDLERARVLSLRAIALAPLQTFYLNTLGVVEYRLGRYADATAVLERSLAAGHGRFDGFDLFFLAMAHHRLGHCNEARTCFDRAVAWERDRGNLTEQHINELAAFHAEAVGVLGQPSARPSGAAQ
jgi:serine/threonine protein kinase/WD40 repeat protein/tetratricopeptide (TPR) repeat protein